MGAVARVVGDDELATDAGASIDHDGPDKIHCGLDRLLTQECYNVEDHGLRGVANPELFGVTIEDLRLVAGDDPAGFKDDELDRIRAVEFHPQEWQLVGKIKQIGPAVGAKPYESQREENLIGGR